VPSVGARERTFCRECGEPTTHVFKKNDQGETGWACAMCESAKYRTPEEIARIKTKRKGWKTSF